MKSIPVPAFLVFSLLFLIGAAIPAAQPVAAQAAEPIWAESVVMFKAGAGTIGSNFSDPQNALGPVDAAIVSMGNAQTPAAPPADPAACEAVLIVSFGAYSVMDGEGADLTIYESAVGSLLEPVWVYVGGAATGWRFVGEAAGGKDAIDIGGAVAPSESFSEVALCDIPDGDTTIGATPGPDIDAVAILNSFRPGLLAQAQGPGWRYDPDPGPVARHAFLPMPVLADLYMKPPVLFQFNCPAGVELDQCTAFLIIRGRCGGDVTLVNPLFAIYPLPQPTLRDLQGWYLAENVDRYAAFCDRGAGRAAAAAEPIALFALQSGGARYDVVEPAWRFALETPVAAVYSAGANQFTAVHNPAAGQTTLRALRGSVEVDPTAVGAGPFVLAAGQQVVITAQGPGAVIDLAEVYLPAAMK